MNQEKIRTKQGVVVSNKMDKSCVVQIERQIKHPKYKKYIKRSSKIMAHDEQGQANIGDVVTIKEVKPISKNKSWQLVDIVKNARK